MWNPSKPADFPAEKLVSQAVLMLDALNRVSSGVVSRPKTVHSPSLSSKNLFVRYPRGAS